MRARYVLDELRRCAVAASVPLLVAGLFALVDLTALADPEVHLGTAARRWTRLGGVVVVGTWLAIRLGHAALQPRRDRAAAEHFTLLRDGASTPGCLLAQVATITWVGPAGQRALGVDVLTGNTHDLWFPETALPAGAFVLTRVDGYVATVIDHMTLPEVDAARRHRDRRSGPPHGLASDPVAEAERLLRRDAAGT